MKFKDYLNESSTKCPICGMPKKPNEKTCGMESCKKALMKNEDLDPEAEK